MSGARTMVEPMMGGPGRHQVSLATPACKCLLLNHSLCFSLFSWSRSSKPSVKLRSPGSRCASCLVYLFFLRYVICCVSVLICFTVFGIGTRLGSGGLELTRILIKTSHKCILFCPLCRALRTSAALCCENELNGSFHQEDLWGHLAE